MSYFKGIGRKSKSFTGRKLPLIGLMENKKHTIFNEYVPGSGVGSSSISVRRIKKKQSRIKKCVTIAPIIPITLDTENIFEIDDTAKFDDVESILNTLPLNTTLDLGTIENENVDANVYTRRINDIINAIKPKTSEDDEIKSSITFTTRSSKNPALSAINEEAYSITDTSINDFFQFINEDSIIKTYLSEEINAEENISQDIEHTLIYNGKNDSNQNIIEYIMTITRYTTLIN